MTHGFEQSAIEAHAYLLALEAQRALASIDGPAADPVYVTY